MPRGRPVFISKEELINLYINKGLSTLIISRKFGLGDEAIRKKLVRFGIPRRSKSDAQKLKVMTPEHIRKLREGAAEINRGKIGPKHHMWKGGRHINSYGYVMLRVNKKYVQEHRHVMQEHLGHTLHPWQEVHHVNGIKTDNRIDNLEVIPNEHKRRDWIRKNK